jgi:methionine synthase II (cobalamin-independent)
MPSPFPFEPRCLPTTLGSLPHTDAAQATALLLAYTPEIPTWAQLPKRTWHENMMVQYLEGLPSIVEENERAYFDTSRPGYDDALTNFFTRYLAVESGDDAALETFAITPERSRGWPALLTALPKRFHPPVVVKGQVTGPFTWGTNLTDQNRRCVYYDEQLHDVIVKGVKLKALWQIKYLKTFGAPVMIWMDEPALLGFGSSTFISISREDVLRDLNEVAGAIHAAGALTGVHCEANTDWSLLMEADLDILDFDAYDHLEAITLYPNELRAFFDRGGSLGWGIVPTLNPQAAATETVKSLLERFDAGVARLEARGFARQLLLRRALITPSCGAGTLTQPLAERVLGLLRDLAATLRKREGFASG